MKYLLNDTMNTFSRAKFIAKRGADAWEKAGMALMLSLSSSNQVAKAFGIDHAVFALEGKSWRKAIYPQYKAKRRLDESALTDAEIEENKMFWETYDSLVSFLTEKSNASVIRCPVAEADDVIARFIKLHPNDEIIINSTDTDYDQLLSDKVKRYNGVLSQLFTVEGRYEFNRAGKLVPSKKFEPIDPKFELFLKCVRGDTSDDVMSAYPGVRLKGSSKKVGIMEAYADREKKGYDWNSFMLTTWTDHLDVQKRVLDEFNRNVTLIDLDAQPIEIKDQVDGCIRESLKTVPVSQVGLNFLRFCGKHELKKIAEHPADYVKWLNAPYKGVLND